MKTHTLPSTTCSDQRIEQFVQIVDSMQEHKMAQCKQWNIINVRGVQWMKRRSSSSALILFNRIRKFLTLSGFTTTKPYNLRCEGVKCAKRCSVQRCLRIHCDLVSQRRMVFKRNFMFTRFEVLPQNS